jgi:hypothetical protein
MFMNEVYEYLRIKIKPRSWPKVIEQINQKGSKAFEKRGGKLYGLWVSQIGLPSEEGVVMTTGPRERPIKNEINPVIAGIEDILDYQGERLAATVRPVEPIAPTRPGIYAHRWFDILDSNWNEFLELSEGAWPTFEKSFDAEIIGFWRSLDVQPPKARVLLLTRYPSLAVWEISRRGYHSQAELDTLKRFRRRHELTESTCVVTMALRSGKGKVA